MNLIQQVIRHVSTNDMNLEISVKIRFLQGRMHVNQVELPLKELPLKLTFQQQKSNFTLLSAPENP